MKVIEHIEKTQNPLFSFEIIPPKRGTNVQEIIDIVKDLQPFNPPYIDVTSHSAEAYYEENNDGLVKRHIRKKRPGTISICGIIQNRFKIDTVPHLLCRGFTKEETEDALIELSFLGIQNIIAISGDGNPKKMTDDGKTINQNSLHLVQQIKDLSKGKYLNEISNSSSIDMCIGIGCYPENHSFSSDFDKEINLLKQKIDLGATYAVTQMCFDNKKYFSFVDKCRKENITIPII